MKNKILFLLILILSLTGCTKPSKFQTEFMGTFDTVVTVIGYTKTQKEFTQAAQYIQARLFELNNYFDIYNEYKGMNNIKTINDNAGIAPVEVDPIIIELIKLSLDAYEYTDGKVNIAMGSVLKLWHDEREKSNKDPSNAALPSMEELIQASHYTDIENIIIDEENNTVYITNENTALDVGAIAKGYAAEVVAREIYDMGYTDFVLSLGGNVRSLDNPNGEWSIGIQNPQLDVRNLQNSFDTLKVNQLSVVTSGDYQRYYTVDGMNYNHIISPDTLMPADSYKQVTVICQDSGWADILSTAIFIMPFEEGLQLLENYGAEGIWIFQDGSVYYTEGYPQLSQNY